MTPHEKAERYEEHPMVQRGLAEIDSDENGRPIIRLKPEDPELEPAEVPIRAT